MNSVKQEVMLAENRIRPYIRETPLDFSLALTKATGTNVYLKCENLQYIGKNEIKTLLFYYFLRALR